MRERMYILVWYIDRQGPDKLNKFYNQLYIQSRMLNQQQPRQEVKPAFTYRPASISLGGVAQPRPNFAPQAIQSPPVHFMVGSPQPIHAPNKLKNQDALVPTQHTLKKSGNLPSEATLKKHTNRASSNLAGLEREVVDGRGSGVEGSEKPTEVEALRDEIGYLRRRLAESENGEKSIRLELELLKASRQGTGTVKKQEKAGKMTSGEKIARLKLLQKEQELNQALNGNVPSSNWEEKRQELTQQIGELNGQVEACRQEMLGLRDALEHAKSDAHRFSEDNGRLRHVLSEKDELLGESRGELCRMRAKNDESDARIGQLEAEIERLGGLLEHLTNSYESKLRQLESLIQRERDFDKRLVDMENSVLAQGVPVVATKTTEDPLMAHKLATVQGEVKHLRSENQKLSEGARVLRQNERIMMGEIEYLRNELNTNLERHTSVLNQLEGDHKVETVRLKQAHVLREHQFKAIIKRLEGKLQEAIREEEKYTMQYQKNLEVMEKMHQEKLKEERASMEEEYSKKLSDLQNSVKQGELVIEGKSLSKDELNEHIQLLKGQTAQSSSEQVEVLSQEIELLKVTHERELDNIREQYEKQLTLNNEEYSHQLSVYMREVEILLSEMEKLKSSQKYMPHEEIIEEESEEENEYEEDKVKKDIIAHGDDASDLYMSPPSDKAVKGANQDRKEGMIEDIMHLDQRINNYITNFRKKESAQEKKEQ